MSDEYYRSLEDRLRVLLSAASDLIEPRQAAEIEEFVEYSEYGVALVWLADCLVGTGRRVPANVVEAISELAEVMGIGDEIDTQLVAASPES